MATTVVALASAAWTDSGGTAGTTFVLECDAPTDTRNRKRPAARWHLSASVPAVQDGHAIWPSDFKRGAGAVQLAIPTGERLWLRRESASVDVLVTAVG